MLKFGRVRAGRRWSRSRFVYPVAALMCWAGAAGTAVAQTPAQPARAWVTDITPLNLKQGTLVLHWTPVNDPANFRVIAQYQLPGGKGCSYTPLPGDTMAPGPSGTTRVTTTNYRVNVVCGVGSRKLAVQAVSGSGKASLPTWTEPFAVPPLK